MSLQFMVCPQQVAHTLCLVPGIVLTSQACESSYLNQGPLEKKWYSLSAV